MIRTVIVAMAASALLGGCQTMRSERVGDGFAADLAPGFHYSLPRVTVKLRYSASEDGRSVAVSLVETAREPDPVHRYAHRYLPSATADDSVVIEVDAKGLLKSVDVTTDDRTDDVAQKVIEIGKGIAKIRVAPPLAPRSLVRDKKPVLEWVIDPTSARELAWVNATLAQVGLAVDVVDASGVSMAEGRGAAPPSGQAPAVDCTRSVCYRPLEPYRLLVKTTATPAEVLGAHPLLLPNRAPVIGLDVERAAFVQKVTKIEFSEGTPTKLTLTKPSEALAFIEIPLAVITAILSLPGEIVDANIAAVNKDKAQLEALESRLQVLERVQTLEDKQREREQAAGVNPLTGAPAAAASPLAAPCNPVLDADCDDAPATPAAGVTPAAGTGAAPELPIDADDPAARGPQFATGYRLPQERSVPAHLKP